MALLLCSTKFKLTVSILWAHGDKPCLSPTLAANCFRSQFAFHCHVMIPRAVAMLGCLSSLSHTPAICASVGDNTVDPIVRQASVLPFCLSWLSLSQVLLCGYSLSSGGFVWGPGSAYRRAPLLPEECLSMCWTVNVRIKSKGLLARVKCSFECFPEESSVSRHV